jgi:hypothetical protein
MTTATRVMIRFDGWYRILSSALLLLPEASYVELDDTSVRVRMGWGFSAEFPRASIARVWQLEYAPLSRGVHGMMGRWLVNGSGDRIAVLELEPPARARVMGFPVKLRQLMVSVDEPSVLLALAAPAS